VFNARVIGCLHDLANVQQTSSKRPALARYFEYICWKFAGRLLDRVNIPLITMLVFAELIKK